MSRKPGATFAAGQPACSCTIPPVRLISSAMLFMIHIRRLLTPRVPAACAAVLALMMLPGCEPKAEAGKDLMARAEKKAKAGDYSGAIAAYESALDDSSNSADVHYRLGIIYDDKLKDPVGAIHHFRRYLALAPDGPRSKEVRRFVGEAEFKLRNTLSEAGTVPQKEAARLKNENLDLRRQIAELRVRASQTPPPKALAGEQVQRPVPPGSRTYVVEPGDTLAAISRKFYKNSTRWKDIQDANFYSLNGAAKLKPGMKLIIPQ
jgi:nucleoid-associated protein YgaU